MFFLFSLFFFFLRKAENISQQLESDNVTRLYRKLRQTKLRNRRMMTFTFICRVKLHIFFIVSYLEFRFDNLLVILYSKFKCIITIQIC